MFKSGLTNRKTTLAAVAAALSAVFGALSAQFDADPATVANWAEVATVVFIAAGLLFARDADKTSENSGAK